MAGNFDMVQEVGRQIMAGPLNRIEISILTLLVPSPLFFRTQLAVVNTVMAAQVLDIDVEPETIVPEMLPNFRMGRADYGNNFI